MITAGAVNPVQTVRDRVRLETNPFKLGDQGPDVLVDLIDFT
nr:hypothetical protein [Micromonospora sp. DSM 115978]